MLNNTNSKISGAKIFSSLVLCVCIWLTNVTEFGSAQVRLRRDLQDEYIERRSSIDPELPTCEGNQYYDTSAFICRPCPAGRVADSKRRACICGPSSTTNKATGQCERCPRLTAPDRTGTKCLSVEPVSGDCNDDQEDGHTNGLCAYKPGEAGVAVDEGETGEEVEYRCPAGQRKEDRQVNGEPNIPAGESRVRISCVECPEGQYPGPGWECKRCADPTKTYQEAPNGDIWKQSCQCTPPYAPAGAGCVADDDRRALEGVVQGGDLEKSNVMRFRSVIDEEGELKSRYGDWKPQEVNSEVLSQQFTLSAVGCWKYGRPQMCQALANLCVLTLYDRTSIPCDFLLGEQITEAMGSQGAPWIFYKQTADELIRPLKELGFNVVASFAAGPSEADGERLLAFWLAQYSVDGRFLGFTELKTQLSICPMSYENVLEIRSFGTITVNECEFYLEDLQTTDQSALPEEANVFYELYLEDKDQKLIDVPVLVRNYLLNTDNPDPNRGDDKSTWKMARRFTILDTASGVVAGTASPPKFVRWASDIKLKVQMDENNPEAIYRPYLTIDYKERETTTFQDSAAKATASLTVEYYSDYESVVSTLLVWILVLSGISVFVSLLRCRQYTRRNPSGAVVQNVQGYNPGANSARALRFAFYIFDNWSHLIFCVLFGASAHVFFAYKTYESATLLLPSLEESANQFAPLLILTLFTKVVAVLIKIHEQNSMDIYLVDQEPPNRDTKQVNAWRHYFIANELSELQSEARFITPETTFIWFAFFWVGLGFQHYAQSDPNSKFRENLYPEATSMQPPNVFLKYFAAALIFLAVGFAQCLIWLFFAFCTSDGSMLTRFVDLCTLANVSVLLFREHNRGFYIHGQAPWRKSDIPLDWLQKQFNDEASGKMRHTTRGLKNNPYNNQRNSDLPIQTYQIYLPTNLRQEMIKIRTQDHSEAIDKMVQERKRKAKERGNKIDEDEYDETSPLNEEIMNENKKDQAVDRRIREMEYKKTKLNALLSRHLGDNIKSDCFYQQDFTTKLLASPPQDDMTSINKVYVIGDVVEKYPEIGQTCFCSLDWSMLQLYIMFFIVLDEAIGRPGDNGLIALFFVYILERAFRFYRKEGGLRNICEKAYVDERFLS